MTLPTVNAPRCSTAKFDAERWLTEVEHPKHIGEHVDPDAGRITFRDFAEGWRTRQAHARSTQEQVEVYLRRHVYPILGDRELRSVRPSDIQAWVADRSKELAPGSVELAYRYVSKIFRDAERDRLIARTPCDGIKLPRKPKPVVNVPTTAELDAVAATLPERYRVDGVTRSRCRSQAGGVPRPWTGAHRVPGQTARRDTPASYPNTGAPELVSPKTPSSVRTVPLAQVVLDGLSEHIRRFPPEPDGLLVVDENGRPLTRSKWAHTWRSATRRAEIEDIRFHDLRHYYASALISSGCSVKVVQTALCHASATETLNVYSHLWPSDDDRTREAVQNALGGAAEEEATPIPQREAGDVSILAVHSRPM